MIPSYHYLGALGIGKLDMEVIGYIHFDNPLINDGQMSSCKRTHRGPCDHVLVALLQNHDANFFRSSPCPTHQDKMDYNSIHGPGISNFSSSSSPRMFPSSLPLRNPSMTQTDRLATVSAAQALIDLNTSGTRCISTGLRDLDALLQNRDPGAVFEGNTFFGGVSRGKVTEIWGPPGVGKTVLGYVIRCWKEDLANESVIGCSWLVVL
jgi:hypothetical protein